MEGDWMPGDAERGSRDRAVDLPRLVGAVGRRIGWILIPTFLAFGLALVVVILVPPRYTGVAKILLENQESYYTRPDRAGPEPAPALDAEAVQSEAETILTPELARQAIARLSLAERPEFNQAVSTNPLAILLAMAGLGGAGAGASAETRVVDAFLARLTAFPVAKTRVLQIEFVSEDPELAARGANVVAQLFLAAQETAKRDSARAAAAWLAGKIDELRAKVADADAKVENFRAESGLLGVGNNMTASGQQLADLNNQLATAKAAQSQAAARAQLMRALLRERRVVDAPELARDESLRRYAEQRVTLKAQIAQEARTLLPGHPRMKELAAQLEALDAEIAVAVDKAARGLENDARLAAAQVASLTNALAAQSKVVASGNVDEVALRALELDAHTARDQLESYVQKYREATARVTDNASPADARIISVASPPRFPTFPKKLETLALGTLAGLMLSTGVVVSHALLSIDAVAPAVAGRPGRRSRAAAAAVDPERMDATPVGTPQADPETAALVDQLLAGAAPGAALRVLIAGEGESASLAIALAAARRLSGRGRAILVDLGPTAGAAAEAAFGPEADGAGPEGLAQLLAGEASFAEAIQRDGASALDVIRTGGGAIAGEGLDEILSALAAAYDFVLVHAADWRSERALAALDAVHKLVVAAPAARLPKALALAREAMGGGAADVIGHAAIGEAIPLGRAA